MPDTVAPKGRGRGRGRRVGATTLSGATIDTNTASPSPQPAAADSSASASRASSVSAASGASGTPAPFVEATEDAPEPSNTAASSSAGPQRRSSVKRVPSVGVVSTRAPSVGLVRTPSIGLAGGRDRPVGGLLGSTSEFRKDATAGPSAGRSTKFKPNMRRKERVVEDDEDDVKMEDGDSNWRNKRGPRPPPRARQELQMTASGPMAQGPGGPPKTWSARPTAGASGAAVMAASRAGTLNQMLDDDEDASDLEVDDDPYDEGGGLRFKAVDLNDIGAAEKKEGDDGMAPLTLPRDPKVLRTKIRRLQERKQERLKKEAARAKSEAGVKAEPQDDSLPGSGTSTPATAATPAPLESKEGSLALLSVDEEKEAKDLKDLEEEEQKEIILSEAFDLAPETRGELYMFQFPRKFPEFVPSSSVLKSESDPSGALSSLSIKPDPDAPAPRKVAPPPWGRFGTRTEKAARWTASAGATLQVLPAAQPSFLQEIAVLDHPPKTASTNGTCKPSKTRHRSSSASSSSSSSSSSTSPTSSKPKYKSSAAIPADSLVILGQTSKKFIVVPQIEDLLEKVGEQEKREREEERRIRIEKAKREGGVKREGKR
ncbi:hypothetical protein Rt10032_c06g2761 [Rhodotorula toruloides]|uniref:Uncharacterized protein n=1 Tax=Rhodotorula toruloides TaxID=5286 RepID=A0A511KH00_RHOTO|nr:hypothetical protein Rt10032_c06g2761 [Rhodotorula toruloides]